MSGCEVERYLLNYSGGISWRASTWKNEKRWKDNIKMILMEIDERSSVGDIANNLYSNRTILNVPDLYSIADILQLNRWIKKAYH
jgi:hypothetical protein